MKTKFIMSIAACWLTMCGANAQTFSQGEIYDFEVGDIFQYRSTFYHEQHGLRRAHSVQLVTNKFFSATRDTVIYEAIEWQIHAAYLYFTEPADIETPFQTSLRRIRLAYSLQDSIPFSQPQFYTTDDCDDTLLVANSNTPSALAVYARQCGALTRRSEKIIFQQLVDYKKTTANVCGCRKLEQKAVYFNHKTELIWRSILGLPIYDL